MKKLLLVLALGVFSPLFTFASLDSNLSYGMSGSGVLELQEFLQDQGLLTVQPTGSFYSLTLKAVKTFQSREGIPNTGYVGPLTRARINTLLSESWSNQDEDGNAVSAPAPAANTGDVVNALQQQINQLQLQNQKLDTIIQGQALQPTQNVGSAPPPPPAPVDISTLRPAEFGSVYVLDNKNYIPITFNDAYRVSIYPYCDLYSRGSAENAIFEVTQAAFPNGYTFQSTNRGLCKITVTSYVQDGRIIDSRELTFDSNL